jgi:hypothetical protein
MVANVIFSVEKWANFWTGLKLFGWWTFFGKIWLVFRRFGYLILRFMNSFFCFCFNFGVESVEILESILFAVDDSLLDFVVNRMSVVVLRKDMSRCKISAGRNIVL